jgi:predicted nucleic acid-binding protein
VIVDANLLLYARDSGSPFHAVARPWLEAALNGPTRVGLPWQSLIHDAHLAALAICHGVEVCSADADFARFTEVRWHNPVAEAAP